MQSRLEKRQIMVSITNSFISKNSPYDTKNNRLSFGNGAVIGLLSNPGLTKGLQLLKQNPIAEVVGLDIGTMAVPRIAIESTQNPDYGIESAFRELVPISLNPFGPGLVASAMLALNGFSGINMGKTTINALHSAWESAESKHGAEFSVSNPQREIVHGYVKNVLTATKGNLSTDGINTDFKAPEKHFASISNKLTDIILVKHDKKEAKKLLNEAKTLFINETGVENSLTVKIGEHESFETNIHNLFDDVTTAGKKLFINVENSKDLKDKVESLGKLSSKKTIYGAAISIAALCSLPVINNYLTKRRTGKDGYCAYKDFGKNNDNTSKETQEKNKRKLWGLKTLSIAGMFGIMVSSMGGFGKAGFFKEGGIKNFMNKIEMKEKNAGLNLIRFMYGSSLMSRLLFSRDEQEVKVTTVRDYSGFLNWLVLGPFVTKIIANFADKSGSLMNKKEVAKEGTSVISKISNWLNNVSVKTHGETEAMFKRLPESQKATIPGKRAIYNGSVLGGIAYSMFMLGIGMPMLTNHMTNKAREKQLRTENADSRNNSVKIADFTQENKILFDNFLHKAKN